MSQVFMVRHQAAGVLTGYVFAEEPNELQLAALAKICEANHGDTHPKPAEDGSPVKYWLRVVPVELFDAKTIPELPEPRGTSTTIALPEVTVSAIGTVTNPKKEG